MTGRSSDDIWMDARIRMAERESDESHAGCLDDMLSGIAAVAAENLKAYGLNISDADVVDWLEFVRDGLMDNLLWQEWGNASDLVPSDRKAHCEQAWKAAKERV